jgi:hypothetical protein
VRGTAFTLKKYALVRLVGFGSQALDTTEDVLGLSPVLPSRARRREVLRLEGESESHVRVSRKGAQCGADSGSVGTEVDRACLGVTTRMSEVDAVR